MSLRFRSQLQIDSLPDPQTSNRWEVIMPNLTIGYLMDGDPDEKYLPIVEEITFAPLGFNNSKDIRAITTYYNVPIDKQDAKEANITLYCDTDMRAQYYLKAWRDMVFNEKDEYYYLPYQYKRDIYVYFYGLATTEPTIQYVLKGCYPLLQDDFQLSYSKQAKRVTINQKFNVDRVIVRKKAGSNSIYNNLYRSVQSVTSIPNKLINGVSKSLGLSAQSSDIDGRAQDASYD